MLLRLHLRLYPGLRLDITCRIPMGMQWVLRQYQALHLPLLMEEAAWGEVAWSRAQELTTLGEVEGGNRWPDAWPIFFQKPAKCLVRCQGWSRLGAIIWGLL